MGSTTTLEILDPKRYFMSSYAIDFSPVKWSMYFDKEDRVNVHNNSFRVYSAGITGPVLVLIHGAGYSSLTWALFTKEIMQKIECQILAIDLRGHGGTSTDKEDDLSLQTLTDDVIQVIESYYSNNVPQVVLIGHSLGGAIVAELAQRIKNVVGLCIIDVVEGSALNSLSVIKNILFNRPVSFNSIQSAVEWSLKSGLTRNMEAARVSIPGQIKNSKTQQLAANEQFTTSNLPRKKVNFGIRAEVIIEEEDNNIKVSKKKTHNDLKLKSIEDEKIELDNCYVWKINVCDTENFWREWFEGLSQKFLDVEVPKVLLLANIHSLDTKLTVAQMQGKFQLQVLPHSGHAIHEDQAEYVANIIGRFLEKQKLAIAKDASLIDLPILLC